MSESKSPFGDKAEPAAGEPTPEELADYDPNDYGNGLRLIRMVGGRVRDDWSVDASSATLLYVIGVGWTGYNGKYWDRRLGDDLARRAAHRVARALRPLFGLLTAKGIPAKDAMKFINEAGSAGKTTAMLKQAQSYLTVELDAFDREPLAINCANGTLRIQREAGDGWSARLDPHDPADRLTRMAAVAWTPAAARIEFEQVLLHSLPDQVERSAFQRTCGYGATGFQREQRFFLVQGRGRDGKSTLLDACREALGSYGETASPMTFMEGGPQSASGPQPDLVRLAGDVRFCVLSEPKRGAAWNEGLLKAWTSGSPVTARDLNAKNINFRPVPKLFFEMNAFPKAKGDDDGLWRRILTPQFRIQVPEDQVDREKADRIKASELEGVLAWLVDGVGDWLSRGLDPPDSWSKVVEDYRKTSSPMGDWLNERCVWGPAAREKDGQPCRTLVQELYRSLKEWLEAQGEERFPTPRSFGDFLHDRQVLLAGKDGKGRKRRSPIRLKTYDELQADQLAAGDDMSSDEPDPLEPDRPWGGA